MSGSLLQKNFDDGSYLRQKLVLSILSQRGIIIKGIRSFEPSPGLTEYEVNLLQLFEKLMNGGKTSISQNGTCLHFVPGTLVGGEVEHDCCNERDISYYLEPVIWLNGYNKNLLKLKLSGITNGYSDHSVDYVKASYIPIMKKFGVDDELNLTVTKRGAAPKGGGAIVYTCPVIKQLNTIQLMTVGKVKRIRGVAYTMRVSPSFGRRLIDGAKETLLNFIPDIFITHDHMKGVSAGLSPCYGIMLIAETTYGLQYSHEVSSIPKDQITSEVIETAEDMGQRAAIGLLDEIKHKSVTDNDHQYLFLLYMALCSQNVSKTLIYYPDEFTVNFIRLIKEFLGVTYKIDIHDKTDDLKILLRTYVFSCIGSGTGNIHKSIL